jgi:membrane associated rhomboid family serine protease/Zn-finger nucleic acid-binding protein
VVLDHCEVCRGNFLEPGEVAATFGDRASPRAWQEDQLAVPVKQRKLRCPVDSELMQPYRLSWKEAARVEVDVCPRCQGLWLDEHEGGRLVDVVTAHGEEKDAAQERGWGSYFFQLFTGFPIEVWHPVRRTPAVVYSLLILLVVAHLVAGALTASMGQGEAMLWLRRWALTPELVSQGKNVWTLLTHAFLHGGLAHIIGNLYFLWIFGDNVEDRSGHGRFALLYLVAALAGGGAEMLFTQDPTVPVVGASGAISGIMGAYLVLFPRVRVWVVLFFFRFKVSIYWYLGVWIGLQLLMAWAGAPGVAWWAHIGGFAAGVALGAVERRRLRRHLEVAE